MLTPQGFQALFMTRLSPILVTGQAWGHSQARAWEIPCLPPVAAPG